MLLQDERCPNFKYIISGKEFSTDAKGVIEIKDENIVESFLASGFKKVEGEAKPIKPAKKSSVEKEREFVKTEADRNAAEQAVAANEKVEAAREKPRWTRGNKQ